MASISTLENIVNTVKKSFPHIKDKEIKIKFIGLPYFYFQAFPENRHYTIEIDSEAVPKIKNKRVLIGGIAHEIAHLEIDHNLRGIAKEQDSDRYAHSLVYRRYCERMADVETILRGYGKELYSFQRFVDRQKRKRKRKTNYGLTSKQIRKLVYKR